MQIISAKDYGYRFVVRVTVNPDEPNWVHVVGLPLLDAEGVPVLDDDGHEVLVTSSLVPAGETGDTCWNCRQNWRIKEFVFEGETLYVEDADGNKVRRDNLDLAADAFAMANDVVPGTDADELVGSRS